ncbi:MAG: hypothetical protein JWN04_5809 [Myxococcaceae bacterium]|nr:hypothetical protein [Myxococcaceae bacterium]
MFPARANGSFRSWGFVDAADPASALELEELSTRLAAFYQKEAGNQGYWERAEAGSAVWRPETHPFHCHLASLISSTATVVDFGCGTAHAIRNLQTGTRYIGIEGSEATVSSNRARFPEHRFIHGNMLADHGLSGQADWAVSFFAIEHCIRPDLLLSRMYECCKPGGRIALLCPNAETGMNSLRSGWSAISKREKMRRLRLVDLLASVVEERWIWPRRVEAIHRSSIAFPIYLKPRCLDAPYWSDNDAVYMATERKLEAFLRGLGCEIDPASASAPQPELRGAIIYLIAQKPPTALAR